MRPGFLMRKAALTDSRVITVNARKIFALTAYFIRISSVFLYLVL